MPVHCPVTSDSVTPMTLGALAVPGPPHASTPHAQEPSKSNAIRSNTEKALASQAVPSHPDVGQESAWRQIVLVVDILSACTGEDREKWEAQEGFCASSAGVCTAAGKSLHHLCAPGCLPERLPLRAYFPGNECEEFGLQGLQSQ